MLKMKKTQIITSFLLIVLIFSTFSVFASDQTVSDPATLMTPNINPWATREVVDAQRYDIFELTWYSTFKNDLTQDRADYILKKTEDKISSNDVKALNDDKLEFKEGLTREDYLQNIFEIAKKYDKSITKDTNYIDYFKTTKVLLGNGSNLGLDKIASTEEAVIFSKRYIDYFYNENNLGAKGLMWKVQNKGNTIYMLGSVHIANSEIYPFSIDMLSKFNDSSKLFVEANLLDPNMNKIVLEYLYYQDGTTLKSQIGDKMYEDIEELLKPMGVSEDVYKHMKPWAIALQISNLHMLADGSSNYSAEHGIDMYFLINAMVQDKEIVELEGAEFQYKLFDSLTIEQQKIMLEDNIKLYKNPPTEEEMKESKDGLKILLDAWKYADEDTMREYLEKSTSGEDKSGLNALLLGDRDHGMAEKIDKLLKEDGENTYFVVVGAAHYVTKGAVVDILTNMGYKVEDLNK